MIKAPTLHSLRRSRFLALLLSLVLVLLVSPFLEQSRSERAVMVVLFALVMLAAIVAASKRRRQKIIGLALGIPWLALSLSTLIWQNTEPTVGASFLFIVFNVYTLGIVVSAVVGVEEVDFDILLGAVSAYLLIPIIWAVSYMVIHALHPGAFSLIAEEIQPHFHEFMYFSLTTLTTLGYGDITPISPFARIWSTLEAVVGTLYIALLVARLVGMYQSQRPRQR